MKILTLTFQLLQSSISNENLKKLSRKLKLYHKRNTKIIHLEQKFSLLNKNQKTKKQHTQYQKTPNVEFFLTFWTKARAGDVHEGEDDAPIPTCLTKLKPKARQ